MSTREPTFRLGDDGRHVLWSHECNFANSMLDTWDYNDPSTWDYWHPDHPLPIHDTQGWQVVSTDPLTVTPSILCGSCGVHGFITDGRWIGV